MYVLYRTYIYPIVSNVIIKYLLIKYELIRGRSLVSNINHLRKTSNNTISLISNSLKFNSKDAAWISYKTEVGKTSLKLLLTNSFGEIRSRVQKCQVWIFQVLHGWGDVKSGILQSAVLLDLLWCHCSNSFGFGDVLWRVINSIWVLDEPYYFRVYCD